MYSLRITVESIYLAARAFEIKIFEILFQQYLNTVELALVETDYSIPSLIWPPPYQRAISTLLKEYK